MKTAALLVLAAAASANAQIWNEVGDAGQTVPTVQMTSGTGPLLTINGTMLNDFDFDLYCIHLDGGPIPFSATTTLFGGGDSVLALFDANGLGLAYNDDISGNNFLSRITGNYPAGDYILGVWGYTGSANGAALSSSGAIWLGAPFVGQRAPDGAGAAGTLIGFGTSFHAGPGPYTIQLTGANFCIPTPGAAAMRGLGGLMVSRRRR